MSSVVVGIAYLSAALLAVLILAWFGARHWYWHALSIAAAMAMGFVPLPLPYQTEPWTLTIGCVFAFLFLWGVLGPIFTEVHHFHGHHPQPR